LNQKAATFPLIGLLHNVSIGDVPMPLRVRLCINLANADWIEEVRAAVEARAPMRNPAPQSPYIIKRHPTYLGNKNRTAIEIRPRFGELRNWTLGFPKFGSQPIRWGIGTANGGGIDPVGFLIFECVHPHRTGISMKIYGSGSSISPSASAYAEFEGAVPTHFSFGVSNAAYALE
jgi:hypothetical protein